MKRLAWAIAVITIVALSHSQAQASDGVGATSTEAGGSVAVESGLERGVGPGPDKSAPLPVCDDVILSVAELAAGSAAWEHADPATRPPTAFALRTCDAGTLTDVPLHYLALATAPAPIRP